MRNGATEARYNILPMTRVRRRWFNGLAALSFLVCISTIAIWVRSYWRGDEFYVERQMHRLEFESNYGLLEACVKERYPAEITISPKAPQKIRYTGPRQSFANGINAGHVDFKARFQRVYYKASFLRLLGFKWEIDGSYPVTGTSPNRIEETATDVGRYIGAPAWFVTIVGALLPVYWIVGTYRYRRQEQRIANGQCFRCGYDLRATPDLCPECGSIPPRKEFISS